MSIVPKRSPISAAAELLFLCATLWFTLLTAVMRWVWHVACLRPCLVKGLISVQLLAANVTSAGQCARPVEGEGRQAEFARVAIQ